MPDSTISPGSPAVLRATTRRTNEQGAGAPRRTSPGEPSAAAPGAVRPLPPPVDAARGDRGEPRWRDIQWVDFTSDADSGSLPTAEPTAAPKTPKAPEPAGRPAPAVGDALRRFAKLSPAARRAESTPIAGLATRFTRLPVARLAPAPRTSPERARPAPLPEKGSVVFHPRPPAAAATTPARISPVSPRGADAPPPLSRRAEIAPAPRARPADEADDTAFPAAILVPVARAPEPAEPASASRWRGVILPRIDRARTMLRDTSGAAMAASSLARVGAVLHRQRLPDALRPIATRLAGSLRRLSQYIAARENRLRVTGAVALSAVLIALAAYVGGALLALLVGTNAPARHQAPIEQPAPPAQTPVPVPAPPPSNTPPADPAARAAFYLARAKAGDAVAQYDVGVLYARGEGLVQDYASAALWFRSAAAQGNVAAEYNLGVLYAGGLGVAADPTEALNWYRSAAGQNHPAAQFNLALAYASGAGIKQDYATAAQWYRRAAEQGLKPAMVNLAILYERGSGVDRSPADAYAWYSAAGERGDSGAKARAGELFQQLGDKDKARAEGLAATIGAALDAAASPPA